MPTRIKRLMRLLLGLFLYALGIAITMKAQIGYAPWEVFHAGLSKTVGISIGTISIIAGLVICLLALLLGEKLGLGTLLNMVLIGIFLDMVLEWPIYPSVENFPTGFAVLIAGLFVIALASFFYIGSGFGAGPRDSLMVALKRKTGLPIGTCRAGIEITVVGIGWLLGGLVGLGTLISAIAIGLCVQVTFRGLRFDPTQIHHETFFESLKLR